ncbi:MAG: hypothetical protein A2Y71_03005 [Bacteroidetes bacterium RBG_13_42_15]|nr:MAG: hypothetical protein A2Y71_03005 [Bacteroidetes bacterium RBG_13_42_15]
MQLIVFAMPQNKKNIIIERRSRVADLYLKGTPQYKIGMICKVSTSQVSRDLKILSKKWVESSMQNIDELKARELEKINQTEREAWKGWERSCQVKTKKRHATSDFEKGTKNESSVERIKSAGDSHFLEIILRCIRQRSELLGLESPKKADININTLPESQLDQIIQEILKKADNETTDDQDRKN